MVDGGKYGHGGQDGARYRRPPSEDELERRWSKYHAGSGSGGKSTEFYKAGEGSNESKPIGLTEVLRAIKSGRQIYPVSKDNLTLLINKRLRPGDEKFVEEIQDHIERTYDVRVTVSGGGSGCSKIVFDIKGKTSDEAREVAFQLLKQIAENPQTRELFLKKDVSVAISSIPYARYKTRSGELEVIGVSGPIIDQSTKVRTAVNSPIAVHSEKVQQRQVALEKAGLQPNSIQRVEERFADLDTIRKELELVFSDVPANTARAALKGRVFTTFDGIIEAADNLYDIAVLENGEMKAALASFKRAAEEMRPDSPEALNQYDRTKQIVAEIQRLLSKQEPEEPTTVLA